MSSRFEPKNERNSSQCENQNNACIKQTIQATRQIQGANGELTFDNEHWGFTKSFVVKTFQNGTFQEVS